MQRCIFHGYKFYTLHHALLKKNLVWLCWFSLHGCQHPYLLHAWYTLLHLASSLQVLTQAPWLTQTPHPLAWLVHPSWLQGSVLIFAPCLIQRPFWAAMLEHPSWLRTFRDTFCTMPYTNSPTLDTVGAFSKWMKPTMLFPDSSVIIGIFLQWRRKASSSSWMVLRFPQWKGKAS